MMAGTAMYVVGMAATAVVTQPWHLYVAFGGILGVSQAVFLVPLIPAAMNWFHRRLGLGMGLIMAAWGAGPALAAPVVGLLIERFDWASAVFIITAVTGLVMAALIALFRDYPADKGLLPYGADSNVPAERPQRQTDPAHVKRFTGHMRRTKAYWNMSSIHFLGCVGHAVILVYLVPLAMREGISLVTAAGLLTVLSAVSTVTRMTTPMLCERYGARQVMALMFVGQALPVLMLFWTSDVWSFYLFAVIFGIGYGGEAGAFPILNRQYYGHAPVGSAYGVQMMGAGLGMALGGWIGGPIFDITGSYDIALWLSVGASMAGAVSALMLESTRKLLIPDWNAEGRRRPVCAPNGMTGVCVEKCRVVPAPSPHPNLPHQGGRDNQQPLPDAHGTTRAVHEPPLPARTTRANSAILAASFTPPVSTPLDTSTPQGDTAAMASPTLPGVRPPANSTS